VRAERFEYGDFAAVQAILGPNDRIFVPAATVTR